MIAGKLNRQQYNMRQSDKWIPRNEGHLEPPSRANDSPWAIAQEISHTENSSVVSNPGKSPEENSSIIVT